MNKKLNKQIDIESIIDATKKQSKDEMLLLVHSIKNTLDTTVNLIKNDVNNIVEKVDDLTIRFENMSKDLSNELRKQFETFMMSESERKIVENNFANELDKWQVNHCTPEERKIVKKIIELDQKKNDLQNKIDFDKKFKLGTLPTTMIVAACSILIALLITLIFNIIIKGG
jgi:hypothetical protein